SMRSYSQKALVLFALQITSVTAMNVARVKAQSDETHRGEVDFASQLAQLGRGHDCFFTLEEAWKEGERQDAISSHRIMGAAKGMEGAEPSAKGLDAEISRLQKEMPSLI